MDDLPLGDLAAFHAVARERSFRAAARKRNVSPSALSEAVRRLEEKLGLRLLNRTTRSVTPTEAGERLMERLAPAFSDVAAALDQINSSDDNPAGTLKLNIPSIVARYIMPGLLGRFMALYPDIRLEVAADDSFIDVMAAGFDAGVRYGERLEQDMIAVPLGPREQRYVTAASPAYLEANGTPQHPSDLLEHRCIRHRFVSRSVGLWEFERGEESLVLSPPASLITDSLEIEVGAAVRGLGVLRCFEEIVAPAVATGELVLILDEWVSRFPGPFLYYASRRHMPGPLRAFVDFLKADQKRAVQP
ncbi:LysR family transcriptional regulator [Rhizobium sp. VS19-DR104.2]|uniref:LysR family transcriptional regulator n=1 Tax=unclassified Rhizobium TaxID=2613769 RepID=UPI001C5B15AB|nr:MULTISPECIES: LysR family transcriptional regulator [unclassified Rhizobium]MBZ5758631.1 LysR family transcriptional regulator [Rhizobium sp. VS19-DR96]MBZ5764539.1 LysR family transcriptional regulator [Rhizobium sp. VS19-DR129.2]MBZ5772082.1 LysR family transcriptional regulator [Rhizobium sp. VS19-DRK62.2]MBZ5783231.1 LysR family transcriptional regulator [Rhizobium sp. VS19-DR121]MBZ5800679.1 LysR family transcriptional regulator [Rhizobium sp. VS19-DR181]